MYIQPLNLVCDYAIWGGFVTDHRPSVWTPVGPSFRRPPRHPREVPCRCPSIPQVATDRRRPPRGHCAAEINALESLERWARMR